MPQFRDDAAWVLYWRIVIDCIAWEVGPESAGR